MSFAAITQTVDVLELVLVLLVLLAIGVTGYNLREAWGEMQWALDDADPTMRRLGPSRYVNAVLLFLLSCFILLGAFTGLLVPSAINTQENTLDVVNAINQRIVMICAVLFIALIGVNDAWWRRDSDRRRNALPPRDVVGGK